MSEAEQDYLEKYLNVLRQKTAPDMPDDEFFERFCGDQILKTRDLDVTELASGVVGGPHDGGVDSVYLFANGRLIQEDTSPTAFSEQQDRRKPLRLKFSEHLSSSQMGTAYVCLVPIEAYVDFITGEDGLRREYILAPNLRGYLGDKGINQQIRDTLAGPQGMEFW